MCGCQGNIQTFNSTPVIPVVNTNVNCNTQLSFLQFLLNLIDLNLERINEEDKITFIQYKGAIQSGINIGNYCYMDYNLTEQNIQNVLSKY